MDLYDDVFYERKGQHHRIERKQAALGKDIESLRKDIESQNRWMAMHDRRDLEMFKENMRSVVSKPRWKKSGQDLPVLENGETVITHPSEEFYIQAYRLFNPETWKSETGLDQRYYDLVKNISSIFTEKDNTLYQTNAAFARLLTSEVFRSGPLGHEYEYWAPVFAEIYRDEKGRGLTVEECTGMDERSLSTFLLEERNEARGN
ncbi:MAG: hypothetical protein Q9170_006785, partial [Blastenia crenularia]